MKSSMLTRILKVSLLGCLMFMNTSIVQASDISPIQELSLLKKNVWLPWVRDPTNNACIKYTASLGMGKTADDRSFCNTGDMLLFNALLCYSGDLNACSAVARSQDFSSGRFYRSPMHANPSLHDFGSKYPGSSTDFSKDHTIGVLLYLVADPDRERAKQVARKWQGWMDRQALVTARDITDLGERLGKDAIREATNGANCLERLTCWKESTADSWEDLSRDEKIACGIIVVVNPIAGLVCPSIIKNGKKLKKGGPGILTAFLPHVCEGPEAENFRIPVASVSAD